VLKQRLTRYFAQRAAHPPPAERAFQKAQRLERRMVGPKRVTPEVEALAQRAVELEPTNPIFLNYLLKLQMAQRRNDAALKTVDRLLELVPGDTRAHALRAVLLLEQPSGKQDLAAVEADLKAAAEEPAAAATRSYALGLLELQRGHGPEAARHLRRSLELDPDADVTYYKLFLAERLAGNDGGAQQALAEFDQRRERKQKQAAVLGDVAQHPDRPELYSRAAALFEQHGRTAEAEAIRAAARRRFGRRAGPPRS
jgi:tetratricopeptide (TPR) repeat protein